MNRTNFIHLLGSVASAHGYTLCSAEALAEAATYEPFPLLCLASLEAVGGAPSAVNTSAYCLRINLLSLKNRLTGDEELHYALLEADARDMVLSLATAEGVVGATIARLTPSAVALTHAGDISVEVEIDLTLFA